jgi:hypothetical protein
MSTPVAFTSSKSCTPAKATPDNTNRHANTAAKSFFPMIDHPPDEKPDIMTRTATIILWPSKKVKRVFMESEKSFLCSPHESQMMLTQKNQDPESIRPSRG